MSFPFHNRLVPPLPTGPKFEGRFCKCRHGKIGIVTGYELVTDDRPLRTKYLRHRYYGINYITGRRWQSFDPKPLGVAELQQLTWAWRSEQHKEPRFETGQSSLDAYARRPDFS